MTQELINYCKEEYKNATGNKFPCSNQIVGCYIICEKLDYKIRDLVNQKKAEVLSKSSFEYKVKFDDTTWRICRANESIRGFRYYKVYIDTRISDDFMEQVIMPCMTHYCKEVNFF